MSDVTATFATNPTFILAGGLCTWLPIGYVGMSKAGLCVTDVLVRHINSQGSFLTAAASASAGTRRNICHRASTDQA